MRCLRFWFVLALLALPAQALAWVFEGHEIVAAIAQSYLTPPVRAKVDQILATDQDTLTSHDMMNEATWADRYRTVHKETSDWHFVDTELDHPDLTSACFGFPASGPLASQGPAQDCIVNKLTQFTKELSAPATPPAERLLALKFVLHFVGDIHQPLHASDLQDKGGNCVLLSLGGSRTVNLHSYWDTTVIQAIGDDPQIVASALAAKITAADRAAWRKGDAKAWALESFKVAKTVVYTIGSRPGCTDAGPINLPQGYDLKARKAAALQLQKAGVRLAWILNTAVGS